VTVDYLTEDSFGSVGPRAYFNIVTCTWVGVMPELCKVKKIRAIQLVDIRKTLPPVGLPHVWLLIHLRVDGWVDLGCQVARSLGLPAGTFV